jgi:hypothetical protein
MSDELSVEQMAATIGSLYEESGGDVTRCEFCDEPLDDTRAWKRGLDGAGAHLDCIAWRS